MRTSFDKLATGLFAVAVIVFLLLALALVLMQAAGVVLGLPDAIVLAKAWFKQPAILAAVAVGILGFVVFYVRGERTVES